MNTFPISLRREKIPTTGSVVAALEHQKQRLKFATYMLGAVGTRNTLRAIYDRSTKGKVESPMELSLPELRHPLHITTRPSDMWIFNEVFRQGVYDLPPHLDNGVNGKAIVDLGAYTGIVSALLASRYTDSQVFAVEPHPRNQRHLAINAARYDGQIKVMNGAIASTRDPINMAVFGGNEQNFVANQFSPHTPGEARMDVAAITPADILAELGDAEVGLLKIDIEGAEYELFASGAMDPLLQRTRLVLVETHERFAPGSEQVVAEVMARNGFKPAHANDHTDAYVNLRFVPATQQ